MTAFVDTNVVIRHLTGDPPDLAARAAQEKVAPALEGNSADAVKAQAEVVDKLAEDYVASMVATGKTLVQIISEPTKPLSKLVTRSEERFSRNAETGRIYRMPSSA